MFCREIVDVSQNYQFVDGQLMCFAFQTVQPTGGELEGEITSFLSKAETAFLHLAQRELPLLAN